MRSAVDGAAERLRRAGVPQHRLEAQRLLAFVLGSDRGGLLARYADALDPAPADRFEQAVVRRERREPLQYITGTQEFYGREFAVDARALVPRPETECLIERVLALPLGPGSAVVEVGVGSGCVALTLALERPEWRITGLDVAGEALQLARENAARLSVRGVSLEAHDVARDGLPVSGVDCVVANPPYVSEQEWRSLEPEVREHEPRGALVPGPTGLEAYAWLGAAAAAALARGGWLVVELGFGGEAGARARIEAAGLRVERVTPDLRGIPRVLTAMRP